MLELETPQKGTALRMICKSRRESTNSSLESTINSTSLLAARALFCQQCKREMTSVRDIPRLVR